jgi:serum/glucocorticoid-regulated kinase 2
LHEGVGIPLPEHYQQLLDGRNDQLSTESRPNTVPVTAGFCLGCSNSHKSKIDSSLREAGTSKRRAGGIYALLDFDKSWVLVPATSGTVEHPLWAEHSCKFDVSHLMELSVYLYLENALSTADAGRIQDICLGVARFSPKFEEHHHFEDPNITGLTIAELNQQKNDFATGMVGT